MRCGKSHYVDQIIYPQALYWRYVGATYAKMIKHVLDLIDRES